MWVVASLSPLPGGRRLRKKMPTSCRVSPTTRPSLTSQGSSSAASDSTTSASSEASLQEGSWRSPVEEGGSLVESSPPPDSSCSSSSCSSSTSPYQRLLQGLSTDERWQKEVALGRRVGFYRFRGELGSGNFSRVKVAIHCLTKEKVAVKIMDKSKLDQKTQRMLSREIRSMESLQHPHVIRLYEVVETLSKVYLAMEYASGGELFHKVTRDGRFGEDQARPLFAQVTSAVDHMHKHKIIHRDLKAENVFFSGPLIVKVGDFGFSTHVGGLVDPLSTFCGSPPYAAPELFKDENYQGPFVDLWALGVLLYFMVTGTMPFKAQTVAALKRAILEGQYSAPPYLSDGCRALVCGLLQQNPAARCTLDQIRYSDWMRGQTFPDASPKYSTSPLNEQQDHETDAEIHMETEDEREARLRLLELGLTADMIRDCAERGARSNVTGTYRIILHKLHQSKVSQDEQEAMPESKVNGKSTTKSVKHVKIVGVTQQHDTHKFQKKMSLTTMQLSRKSKACIII